MIHAITDTPSKGRYTTQLVALLIAAEACDIHYGVCVQFLCCSIHPLQPRIQTFGERSCKGLSKGVLPLWSNHSCIP